MGPPLPFPPPCNTLSCVPPLHHQIFVPHPQRQHMLPHEGSNSLLKEAGCEWAVSTSQSTVIYDYDLGLQAVVSLVDLLCKCLRLTAMVKCVPDVQRLSVWLYEHDAEAVMVR